VHNTIHIDFNKVDIFKLSLVVDLHYTNEA